MVRKSRKRQLDKLAQRRAEERRRHRRRRMIALVVGGVIGAGAITVGALALFGGDDEQARTASSPTPGPTTTPEEDNTMAGDVACGGQVPKGADQEKPSFDGPPKPALDESKDYRAEIVTSCGSITVDLLEKETPVTVNNFVFLAREGFYDGTVFHRVISDFMNQAGDPEGTGMGGPGYQFEDEIVDSLTFSEPGLLAMANSGPATNGSQFFITTVPTPHLDGLHTIFGRVTEGMDIALQINTLPTDPSDRPNQTVYIETINIEEA